MNENLFTEVKIDSSDDAVVLININTPELSIPTEQTRSESSGENEISEVDILVFSKEDDEYVFKYRVKGEFLNQGSEAQAQFMALVAATEDPVKLYVLANVAVLLEGNLLKVGMTEAQVRELLVMDFTPEGMGNHLPMFGEHEFASGLSSTVQQQVTVNVLRSIARVDVVKDLEPGSGTFILDAVYVYRANSLIQVIPSALTGEVTTMVDTPSVPNGTQLLNTVIKKENIAGIDSVGQIYLPESTGILNDSEKLTGKTTIVVGGYYNNNPMSYYRIDFCSGLEGHPFGQILRNHRYVFRIKSVLSQGWETPDLAAVNIATAMTVDVFAWENFSANTYFIGNEQFAISSREISLRYMGNRERSLFVESTLGYSIQWLENGIPTGASTIELDTEIFNNNFSAKLVHNEGDSKNINRLVFRTLNDNYNGEIITRTLRISVAGLWIMDITVTQDNAAKYFNRHTNILSVGPVAGDYDGTGNLGVSAVSPDASALAMRKIIDVQFSSGGTIPLGGTIFTRISVSEAESTSTNTVAAVKKIIDGQDVIYFTYNLQISEEIANYLVAWLTASTHRVLIVNLDSKNSNAKLRDHKDITIGSWNFDDIGKIAKSGYQRSPASEKSDYFFKGPFGVVNENVIFSRSDDTAGCTTSIPTDVTPLVSGNTATYQNYIFFGINLEKRIIYHGDANLFMMNSLSNTNGLVNSQCDILMANVWAWVFEQVIYGDE